MDDGATNHTNATVTMTGLDMDLTSANNQGNLKNIGLDINVQGADTNYAAIFRAGNVGVGTATPSKALMVYGNAASDVVTLFQNDGDDQNRYGIAIAAGADNASGTTYYMTCYAGDASTTVGYIANTGGTFALTDPSDRRIKDNIRDTEVVGLNTVNDIKVRDFELKSSGITKTGFVAQELQESYSAAAVGHDDEVDEDGNPVMMSVAYTTLVPVLVKAVQELSAKVTDLEEKLNEK